jgi:hypothetical protein
MAVNTGSSRRREDHRRARERARRQRYVRRADVSDEFLESPAVDGLEPDETPICSYSSHDQLEVLGQPLA